MRGMAARLAACFSVPARWWLLMQVEFDEQEIAACPEQWESVMPLEVDPDLLLTPAGVLHLGAPDVPDPDPKPSLPRGVLETIPLGDEASPDRRQVRVVRYENGSLALVGEAT